MSSNTNECLKSLTEAIVELCEIQKKLESLDCNVPYSVPIGLKGIEEKLVKVMLTVDM